MKQVILILFALGLLTALTTGAILAGDDAPGDWLVDAPDDATRSERLSRYLGGFSSAMWEVGYRYQSTHQALQDDNLELAAYHWEKIRDAIENGYMKRPARQANADRLFLDTAWPGLMQALESGAADQAGEAFERARAACIACHVAEDVAFMNEQPMFRDTAP